MNKTKSVAEIIDLAGDAMANDASGAPRLIGSACNECDAKMFPPVTVCPECMSENLARLELSVEGTLYSWSVVHAAPKGWRLPYIAAYVDLPEGVRVFTHIVEADADSLAFDMTVKLCRARLGTGEDGAAIESYAFTLADKAAVESKK
jgi:uncharacterized OB-fold protein